MKEIWNMNTSGIFYDSADLVEFKKWFNTGILGGATTNPVILQKEGVTDLPGHITRMIEISGKNFPISIEIPDSDWSADDQVELGLGYGEMFPDNAVVKVPMDPREPQKSYEVIHRLGRRGVRINATVGMTAGQLIAAAEALRGNIAEGDNYISLFWGRCEEAKGEGAAARTLTTTLRYLEKHSLKAKVIIGSIRNTDQIDEAFSIGAHIVTIPPKLIVDWMFTKRGVETIDQFNDAYREVKDNTILI